MTVLFLFNFMLIIGNHDKRVGQLPHDWPIEVFEPGNKIDRVTLGHPTHEV